MKPNLTTEQAIKQAVLDVQNAMLENLEAGRAEVQAKDRKVKAHYNLLRSKERLYAIEREMLE
jgi:hypothetical protein